MKKRSADSGIPSPKADAARRFRLADADLPNAGRVSYSDFALSSSRQRSWTNPGLNGLILGVLVLGIIYAFRQVIRLYREIGGVNAFRISDPGW